MANYMNCYKCETLLTDPREFTAFCSKECQNAYYDGNPPVEDRPGRKHSIAEVQRMLLEKAKTAPKAERESETVDIVSQAYEKAAVERSDAAFQEILQPVLLPYADD